MLATLAVGSTPSQEHAPSAAEIEKAGELFQRSCASCHLPPDAAHATDLAWLGQVNDTA